jgi:hypothetical protein
MAMPGKLRAGAAACVLLFVLSNADAAESGWLTDPANQCAVFAAGGSDRVAWAGDCAEGLATGLGTAIYFHGDKQMESFTADFSRGMAADGHVIIRWDDGWLYDGEQSKGRFNGGGLLVNNKKDRYLGLWTDGRMNGFGLLERADGSRYAGDWKNDLPNGEGELRHADGSVVSGLFTDGRLVENRAAAVRPADPALKSAALTATKPGAAPAAKTPSGGPFAAIAGVTLKGVDGSSIALHPIEGGIEMALTAPGGAPQKTTFTFMTDRLGTVVEDGGPDRGANVTGFFRLTDDGVELHYADGRAETLSATPEGGVLMVLTSVANMGARTVCRSWYPDGHVFSEAEKKAALADYAVRLGLPANPADGPGCAAAPAPAKAVTEPAPPKLPHAAAAAARAPARAKAVKFAPPAPAPAAANIIVPRTPVTVNDSQVHTIDEMVPAPAANAPLPGAQASLKPQAGDPSHCLKIDSDGLNWGFRNVCDFPIQFSYCAPTEKGLAGCAKGGAPGSVAARGFGALMADRSLGENGVDHSFRWIACAGGAGEVIAHLDQADPPSGRCERAEAAIAAAH